MKEGWILKDILYGELIAGKRNFGQSQLRYWDVWKRELKELKSWEEFAMDCPRWKSYLQAS